MAIMDIYTDGGNRPVPKGYGGWGFYGKSPDGDWCVTGYGGAGIDVTNNIAEMHAVINIFTWLIKNEKGLEAVRLLLDAEIIVNILLRFDEYRGRNFCKANGDPLANNDLWRKIAELRDQLPMPVTYGWVKGHSGIYGNEQADMLARKGIECQKSGDGKAVITTEVLTSVDGDTSSTEDEIIDVDDLKVAKYPFHAMVSGSRWYFRIGAANVTDDGKWIYSLTRYSSSSKEHMTKREKDDIKHKAAGRRSSNNHFALILADSPILALENIRNKMSDNAKGIAYPCVGLIPEIKSGKYIGKITTDIDKHSVFEDDHLCMSDAQVICSYVNPPLLIYRLEDRFTRLMQAIESYRNGTDDYNYTDVTDQFVEVDAKGKHKLSVGYPQSEKTKVIKGVSLGGDLAVDTLVVSETDIPSRNVFSAMVKADKTKKLTVTILTYDVDPVSYRFITIVQWGTEIGAYYTDDANYRRILPDVGKQKKK